MSQEESRVPGLAKAFGLLAAAVGGPVAAWAGFAELRARPWFAAALLVAYEILVLILGFAGAVGKDLSGRWTPRVVESIDAWLQRRLSRFAAQYLRYVAASTRYMDVKGLSTPGEYTLEMKDVMVRLAMVSRPMHDLSPDPVGRSALRLEVTGDPSIWRWLRQAQREAAVLAIIGPPGSGKTTLLRHVAHTLAKGGRTAWSLNAPRRIPVLVNLREHKQTPAGMVELLRHSLAASERPVPPGWIETHLRRGHFLIMLDGLDEIPDPAARAALTGWVERQLSTQPGNLLVITSRPFGYRESPITGALVVEVQRLADVQIAAFIRQWYRTVTARSHNGVNESSRLAARAGSTDLLARLQETPQLGELTANPLLLTLIVNVHYYRGALPGTRSELYQEICEVFLGKRHQARGVQVDLPSRQKQAVLRVLAYEMMTREISEVSAEDAAKWTAGALARVSGTMTPPDFLRSVEDSSGLLLEKERGVFSFAHLTFQEFLAAEHLRESGLVEVLVHNVGSAWWRETTLLYCAVADATPVVAACLARADRPALVAFAVQCVEEAREVAPETRRLLDSSLNPPDLRTNPVSRQSAAQIRLLLRANRDRSVRQPITHLEYQYFLDSIGENRLPDHWTTPMFPPGAENEPVTGVRYEDALAFCGWLTAESSNAGLVSLPHVDEIRSAARRDGGDPVPAGGQLWTATTGTSARDAGFEQLLRVPGSAARHDPYPPASAVDGAYLSSRLAADLPSGDDPRLHPVVNLVWAAATRANSCDVGQLERQIELTRALGRQYAKSKYLYAERERQLTLVGLLDELHSLGEVALDRGVFARRLGDSMRAARARMRTKALLAALAAVQLHRAHGGKAGLQKPGWIPRPTARQPLPSGLPVVITNALAHALVGIYLDLVVLEARIERIAPATESIAYVRQREPEPTWDAPTPEALRPREPRGPFAKRLFDILAAASLLIVLAPVLVIIGVLVGSGSRGPVIFRQERVGRYGRAFVLYKFRTMVVDAEARLQELRNLNDSDGVLFKMRDDPRLTRTGRWLRRYSLDELPQLVNVLKGDMSLVGPRPPLPREVAGYPAGMRRRLQVKPGLTSLWQVSGGSDLSWDESIRLDLMYVDNWSIRMDLGILLRTVSALVRGYGAY